MSSAAHATRESPALFPPLGARRTFVIGGILLILAGMIFGDIFAVFVLHQNGARISDSFSAATNAVATGNVAGVSIAFQNIGDFLENHGTKVDAHVHMIGFGYLALMLALLQPMIAMSEIAKKRLAVLFLAGAVLLPVGVLLIRYVGLADSPFATIGWASIFADLGGLLVFVVGTGEFAGLWRYWRSRTQPAVVDELSRDRSWSNRALLAGGALLVLFGFLHGAYYAGFHLYSSEAKDQALVSTMAISAASNQPAAAASALRDYDQLQVAQAVNVAAHSHIIEFGILAILLGLFQPYVFLDEPWKRIWAVLLLVGSYILPAFVFMELRWGLVAGGIADVGGLLVVIALFGMLTGILRYTGRLDAPNGVAR
ncbi:MAG TPA: hypothetical protein VNF00_02425 [Candidatus Acidoferrales bacterium]|nr:hypothetical protein [Candidatus Acidoferrales bacterium]